MIITAGFAPLRNKGEAYDECLKEAKVPVISKRYESIIHGFFWMPGVIDEGKKAIEQVAKVLKSL